MSRRRPTASPPAAAAAAPPPVPLDGCQLRIGGDAYGALAACCAGEFAGRGVVVVADADTWRAAGARITAALAGAGIRAQQSCLFPAGIRAELGHVEAIEYLLIGNRAIPLAVGSGTLADLVKLAAHRTGRPCLVAATAASMDGYAASGASIERSGDKRTHPCPAPRLVAVDLDVIAAAPVRLCAAGYADLLAKVVSGADWILAEELGIEAIQPQAWQLAQEGLQGRLADPARLIAGDRQALAGLVDGLLRSGQAMHAAGSSRPASGAEHQFSHLWDMEGIGHAHLHGFKVGIGILASAAFYDLLLAAPVERLDVARACAAWPTWEAEERRLRAVLRTTALRSTGLAEAAAKHPARMALAVRLERLVARWPQLRSRLQRQLLPVSELRRLLAAVGAPVSAVDIGVPRDRLRAAFHAARPLRRRYTILDLAAEAGWTEAWLAHCFGRGGSLAD